MKQIFKIDRDGCLIFGEEKSIPIEEKPPAGYVDTGLPRDLEGDQLPFHKPRWNGTEWVEGLAQEEIDELNKPQPKEPTEMDVLKAQNKALSDRQEFLEDVIAEMAMMIYD